MIRIAICDDNDIQRELLNDVLSEYIENNRSDITITDFSSGEDLIRDVHENGKYDLYYLDMIMPGMNGLEVASTLRIMKDMGKIIFLTATTEYAAASYDVDAYYYLVKPIDRDKLYRVLGNALSETRKDSGSILVKSGGEEIYLRIDDIMYVELVERAPNYHTKDGRIACGPKLRVSFKETLSDILSIEYFKLISVNTIVNLAFVEMVSSEAILLRDGTQLFPSRSYYGDFRTAWGQFRK